VTHRLPFGATLLGSDETRFRLWAPDQPSVFLEIEGRDPIPLQADAEGWHSAVVACGAGTRYRYRVRPDLAVPDPASRAQAGDVHDPSIVVDPAAYAWSHTDWRGRPWHEAVIYELHVGLCGGFDGVTARLPDLARLGVTVIELMPIADFPGTRNWGYDGVLPYAADAAYGTPDELKSLIDTAHGLGLMVMLDVVYNHFGPDGNYIGAYASAFWRHDQTTPWGDAIDFRRPEVRRFFVENALFWLLEYRFDGLRLDAVHAIRDNGFLQALADEVRAKVAPDRHVHLVLEHEGNAASLLRTAPCKPGFDAQWADDLHHCLHVLLTGEHEGYYEDYTAAPATMLARCLAEGFAFQGEVSSHTGTARGEPSTHLPPTAFVICLQNHDQIGNRALGERLTTLTHPDALRAATALLLLMPQIPLLFMGQEWGTESPFLFFTDHHGELAELVRQGRRREFAKFAAFADPERRELIPDPNSPASFAASRADLSEKGRPEHAAWLELHRTLLVIRGREIVPHMKAARAVAAEALGRAGIRGSWRLDNAAVLTIAANFGGTALDCAIDGDILFATPGATPSMLPPRSCIATMERPR
jgi:maltooligosyltrehalose trehalohydrolase